MRSLPPSSAFDNLAWGFGRLATSPLHARTACECQGIHTHLAGLVLLKRSRLEGRFVITNNKVN
jgi:hypothetical protein